MSTSTTIKASHKPIDANCEASKAYSGQSISNETAVLAHKDGEFRLTLFAWSTKIGIMIVGASGRPKL